MFGYLAGDHVARAGHRHHHPAAAPDRARGQAGGRGRPAHRAAGSGSASASAGTRSSTRRSAATSPTAGRRIERADRAAAPALDRARRSPTTATFDHVTGAGLAPLPVQRPIPVWIGGASAAGLPARSGGWPTAGSRRSVPGADLDARSTSSGDRPRRPGATRRPSAWRAASTWSPDDPDRFARQVERWRSTGATHLTIDTMRTGCVGVDGHLAALRQAADICISPG